jgi:Zn-dependent protease/CBS domain-containing protein
MGWSLNLGKILGIEVKIHLTFFLLLAWFAFVYYTQGGTRAAINGLLFISLLFVCVLLHEFGHALAARRYGIPTKDITLLPIGGEARLQRMPEKPSQELVVALAGPAVNVVIVLVLFLLLGGVRSFDVTQLENASPNLLQQLLTANIWLVLFNLIPAFPMDGGRVLRALLAMRLPYAQATQIAATTGQGMAFLLGFLGLFFNPLLIIIALFIFLGASQEAVAANLRDIAKGLPVSAAMVTEFRTLTAQATLNDAVEALLQTSQHEFPVVDPSGVRGVLTRDTLIAALKAEGFDTPVSKVMTQNLPTVNAGSSLEEALRLMDEQQAKVIPVLGDNRQLVGLLTAENVGEMMKVHTVRTQLKQSPDTRAGSSS